MRLDQSAVDARILEYYGEHFDEDTRLTTRSAQGPLEFQRTQEIVRRYVQRGRVIDIGGASGHHARALQADGYQVELVDPVPRHVRLATANGINAQIGDARALPFKDGAFAAALLLGPLYHLASQDDRTLALTEAARVTHPGGLSSPRRSPASSHSPLSRSR